MWQRDLQLAALITWKLLNKKKNAVKTAFFKFYSFKKPLLILALNISSLAKSLRVFQFWFNTETIYVFDLVNLKLRQSWFILLINGSKNTINLRKQYYFCLAGAESCVTSSSTSGSGRPAPNACSLTARSISSLNSGFCLRNSFAFSRPCPRRKSP